MTKKQQFLESEWDYCIVLDACRYDVFSDVYDEYLDGSLEKRRSKGSSTPEWVYRTFTGNYDIAYFSGNPFINDIGIPLSELKWGASCDYEWTANDHIAEIVDVWKHGWDDDLGTVPPDSLALSFEQHRDLVTNTDRTVIHYVQPHAPYLARGKGQKLKQIQKGIRKQAKTERESAGQRKTVDSSSVLVSFGDIVRPKIESTLEGKKIAQKAGLWIELDPKELIQYGTSEAAMDLYEENLRIALESVAKLISKLDGKVVITPDHGEAFGEQGVWEHHIETHIPSLMEVPWLIVE